MSETPSFLSSVTNLLEDGSLFEDGPITVSASQPVVPVEPIVSSGFRPASVEFYEFIRGIGLKDRGLEVTTPQAPVMPPVKKPAFAPEPTQGYAALGTLPKGGYRVWGWDEQRLKTLAERDIYNAAILGSIAGHHWIADNYTRSNTSKNKDGEEKVTRTVDHKLLGGQMRDACVKAGIWNDDRMCGGGVWRVGDDLIINSREIFYASTRETAPRVGKKIFLHNHDLELLPDTPQASADDVMKVLSLISEYAWKRPGTDDRLILGWYLASLFCAALQWRTHGYVIAEKGSGKSTLCTLLDRLMGRAGISVTKQGEAGMRQYQQDFSVGITADEMSDAKGLKSFIEYLRDGSGGAKEIKGGGDHNSVKFTIRTTALLFGASSPAMDSQDESRFFKVYMRKRVEQKDAEGNVLPSTTPDHELLPTPANEESTRELGLQIFSRMISSWPRFLKVSEALRRVFTAERRTGDTLIPILAAAFVGLYDNETIDENEALEYVNSFDLREDKVRMSGISADEEMMAGIMDKAVHVQVGRGGYVDTTIGGLVAEAVKDSPRGPWRHALSQYGIKMVSHVDGQIWVDETVTHEMRLVPTWPALRDLLRGTKMSDWDIRSTLLRIPGAESSYLKTDRVAPGAPKAYIRLPFRADQGSDTTPLGSDHPFVG